VHYGCHAQTGRVHDDASAAVAWLRERLPHLTSGRVLDAGCGEGGLLPPGGIGLDLDFERLLAARARGAPVVRADAKALPFADRTFDTAYAHRMLNDTGDVDRTLAELARVLRDGGTLLVFTRARPLGAQTEAKTRSSTQARGRASPDRALELDRLDRWNGARRLSRHFIRVSTEHPPGDERAALFVAMGPRR
jgi:SAM-dependent methyltransferase